VTHIIHVASSRKALNIPTTAAARREVLVTRASSRHTCHTRGTLSVGFTHQTRGRDSAPSERIAGFVISQTNRGRGAISTIIALTNVIGSACAFSHTLAINAAMRPNRDRVQAIADAIGAHQPSLAG